MLRTLLLAGLIAIILSISHARVIESNSEQKIETHEILWSSDDDEVDQVLKAAIDFDRQIIETRPVEKGIESVYLFKWNLTLFISPDEGRCFLKSISPKLNFNESVAFIRGHDNNKAFKFGRDYLPKELFPVPIDRQIEAIYGMTKKWCENFELFGLLQEDKPKQRVKRSQGKIENIEEGSWFERRRARQRMRQRSGKSVGGPGEASASVTGGGHRGFGQAQSQFSSIPSFNNGHYTHFTKKSDGQYSSAPIQQRSSGGRSRSFGAPRVQFPNGGQRESRYSQRRYSSSYNTGGSNQPAQSSVNSMPKIDSHRYGAPGSIGGFADDSPSTISRSQVQYGGGRQSMASASSGIGQKGEPGSTMTQVQGSYSGEGSFSAQSQSMGTGGQYSSSGIQAGSSGASSQTGAMLGSKLGSQTQVMAGPRGDSSLMAQSGYSGGLSSSSLQAGVSGAQVGARSSGRGMSSSQAQINFGDGDSDSGHGGGQASAMSHGDSGMTQGQLNGQLSGGRSYSGSAQSASGRFYGQQEDSSNSGTGHHNSGINYEHQNVNNNYQQQPDDDTGYGSGGPSAPNSGYGNAQNRNSFTTESPTPEEDVTSYPDYYEATQKQQRSFEDDRRSNLIQGGGGQSQSQSVHLNLNNNDQGSSGDGASVSRSGYQATLKRNNQYSSSRKSHENVPQYPSYTQHENSNYRGSEEYRNSRQNRYQPNYRQQYQSATDSSQIDQQEESHQQSSQTFGDQYRQSQYQPATTTQAPQDDNSFTQDGQADNNYEARQDVDNQYREQYYSQASTPTPRHGNSFTQEESYTNYQQGSQNNDGQYRQQYYPSGTTQWPHSLGHSGPQKAVPIQESSIAEEVGSSYSQHSNYEGQSQSHNQRPSNTEGGITSYDQQSNSNYGQVQAAVPTQRPSYSDEGRSSYNQHSSYEGHNSYAETTPRPSHMDQGSSSYSQHSNYEERSQYQVPTNNRQYFPGQRQSQNVFVGGIRRKFLTDQPVEESEHYYESGQEVPGFPGYHVPDGFRARVVTSGTSDSEVRDIGIGGLRGQSQSQSIHINLGGNNRRGYNQPTPAPASMIKPTAAPSSYPDSNDDEYSYTDEYYNYEYSDSYNNANDEGITIPTPALATTQRPAARPTARPTPPAATEGRGDQPDTAYNPSLGSSSTYHQERRVSSYQSGSGAPSTSGGRRVTVTGGSGVDSNEQQPCFRCQMQLNFDDIVKSIRDGKLQVVGGGNSGYHQSSYSSSQGLPSSGCGIVMVSCRTVYDLQEKSKICTPTKKECNN